MVGSSSGLLVEVIEIVGMPLDERIALDDRPRAWLLPLAVECGLRGASLANQVAAGAGPCG